MENQHAYDPIPLEDVHETHGPNEAGMVTHQFYAFNTVITLQAYAPLDRCLPAFDAARAASRTFERRLSRTLPHSDISRLNAAGGARVSIADDTAELLRAAIGYCADSEGLFDITVGSVVRLWNFHESVVPERAAVERALAHVDWRTLHVGEAGEGVGAWAQLADPQAAVDVGGIAKGWIADRLSALLVQHGLESFVVNLGGNVMAHGAKPDGSPWRVGLQDPRAKGGVVGAVAVRNASAVTSGVYERCFERDGKFYHHILDPKTGFPAETDAAGATVIAERSIDAEGFSTTLLAMGIERGTAFAKEHPAILGAYFVDRDGVVSGG